MTNYYKLFYESSGESSYIQQPKYDNTAKAAMDHNDTTSWQEAAVGSGVDEQLWYNFDREYEIRYLSFKLGNWRNDHYFNGNNRPKKLKISIDGYVTEIEFPPDKTEYWVELTPFCSGRQVLLMVEDVYKGNGEFDDTCIAEIGIYGK